MAKVSFYFNRLSHGEFYRMVTGFLRDWQASKLTIEDPVLTKLKTRLTQEVETFGQALAEVKDSQAAKDLEEADRLRDQHLQLLADSVKLGRYGHSPEEKEAYQALAPLFKGVSKAKRSNYEEESSYVLTLLAQLKKTEYQTFSRSLNLTKGIQNLTKSQEAFDKLLTQRNASKSGKVTYDTKATKKVLQETYTKLADYLYVMADEATPLTYGKLYKIFVTNHEVFKPLTVTRTKPKSDSPEPAAEADN